MADAEVVLGTSFNQKCYRGCRYISSIYLYISVIKIMAMVLVYRLAAALVQPIGDSKIADTLDTMAGMLTLVFGAVVAVGFMFFLAIAVIVGLSNLNVMLR